MADPSLLTFTPTQTLILDVLVARYRLGDTLWTFDYRNAAALRKLKQKKLINLHSGVTEGTLRASLTDHALHEHGASWFQLSITLDHLPEGTPKPPDDRHWYKSHLEPLVSLPQQHPNTDPRAINTAHLLILRLVNRHQPVFRISADVDGGVALRRWSKDRVEVRPNGRDFRLHSLRNTVEETTEMHEVFSFMSQNNG